MASTEDGGGLAGSTHLTVVLTDPALDCLVAYNRAGRAARVRFASAELSARRMTPPIHRRISIAPNPGSERHLELSLMGAFELVDEAVPVVLTGASQRLIAFVALQGRAVTRTATAGALWPDVSDAQAHASLRSAIWRLEETAREALSVDVLDLDLATHVLVDVRGAEALAHRLLLVDTMPSDDDITAEAILALSSELLPDWYDDWAILRAEDWRQLRLHALEADRREGRGDRPLLGCHPGGPCSDPRRPAP